MGAQEEYEEIAFGKGPESEIKAMKAESGELKDFYKTLKSQNDAHGRSIVGLTTEKEDVRLRIRALLNKRTAAEGPDFDEYQIQRRTSRQYEPVDHQRRKSSTKRPPVSTSVSEVKTETAVPENEVSLPSSVTITVKAN